MSAKTKNLLAILLVLIAATVFFALRGTGSVTIDTDGDGLRFSGPEGSTYLAYDSITDIRFLPSPDYGSAADGGARRGVLYGTWQSGDLGTYSAYVNEGIPCCILFVSDAETVAFNYESEATTQGFYDSIRALWLEKTAA